MSDLLSNWKMEEMEEGLEPDRVVESDIQMGEIQNKVDSWSDAQKKSYLYQLFSNIRGKKADTSPQYRLTFVVLSSIQILRHYEKLKAQRSKFSYEEESRTD